MAAPKTVSGDICNRINRFLTTPSYIAAVMLLTALSSCFGFELVLYTLFALISVYVCVLGGDLLPLMPLVICAFIAPSPGNNPGRHPDSVFAPGHGGTYLLCVAGITAAAVLYRVIRDRKLFLHKKYELLPGMLLLAGAYLLSGIGSSHYPDIAGKNLLLAALQGCAFLLPYLLFSGGVNWKAVRKDYFPWVGFYTGAVLLTQLLYVYLTGNVIQNGIIVRTQIYTGWGMYNNLGGMLAMMIPFAFYLATKYRRGWIGTVVGSVFYIGVLLTCSRSSMLTGFACCMVCIVLMLYYAHNRKANTLTMIGLIGFISVTVLFFHRQLLVLFGDLLEKGLDPSSRDIIYRKGMELFRQAPLLGNSFFSPGYEPWQWSTVAEFTSFFPPRWHNTIVQLLACCGVVGLAAYLVHRLQTLYMLMRSHTKEKTFLGCSVAVLLVCSLFDCHFFNIGPVLFYAMALAFAENCHAGK